MAWTVSENIYLQVEYRKNLPSLSVSLGGREQSIIMIRPGENFVAGFMGKRLIPLNIL